MHWGPGGTAKFSAVIKQMREACEQKELLNLEHPQVCFTGSPGDTHAI